MIVVTGAGGFIGSHLVDRLLDDGEEVVGLDLPSELPHNLARHRNHPRFRYHACDVRDAVGFAKRVPESTTALFHLAAHVGVTSYLDRPLETIDTIVGGTRNALEVCLPRKTHLIFLSTSEVYGRNPHVPWAEGADRVLGPPTVSRWTYSTSKSLCEHLINAVHQTDRLPTTIVRPFNVYGPRQRPSFVVSAAVWHVLRGERPLLYDTGTQTRCFTFIGDLVDGLMRTRDPKAVGETYNLGSQEEHTVSEAVEGVLRACGSTLEPLPVNTETALGSVYEDIPRRVPDSTKARTHLGWAASTPLSEGIRATVEWARATPEWLADRPEPEAPLGGSRK
jgi:dTDP-alpha-D-glucuronic acid decarboxylase